MMTEEKPKADKLRKKLRVHGLFGKNNNGSVEGNMEALTQEEAKLRISDYSQILNSQAALMDSINITIANSNSYLTPISEKLNKLDSYDTITKIAIFSSFKENLNSIESQIDSFIGELSEQNNQLSSCIYNYDNIIREIENLQIFLDKESKFFQTSVGIVSFNKIRIIEMKNKSKHIAKQIEVLEQFKVSTFYHLKESIENEFVGKDVENLVKTELERVDNLISKIKLWTPKIVTTQIFLLIATIWNYLADKYHITYESTVEIYGNKSTEQSSHIAGISQAADNMLSSLLIVSTVVSFMVFIMGIFRIFNAMRDPERVSITSGLMMVVFAAVLNISSYVFKGVFTPNNEVVGEQQINITYDFLNFGPTGTTFFIVFNLLLACLFMINIKRKNSLEHRYELIKNPLNLKVK